MTVPIGTYPRTIDSGHGQRMTFLRRWHDERGEWLELESEIAPGHGPILHSHPHQDETITVLAGTVSYLVVGQPARTARAGDSMTFSRGIAHRFWNSGTDVVRGRGVITPPLQFEEFMTVLYRSMAANGGRPSLFDVAVLVRDYRETAVMPGVPAVVRRVVFPLVAMLGRLTGRYPLNDSPAAPQTRRSPS